jgi:hypothetical protein
MAAAKRKYAPSASKDEKSEMQRYKRGTAKSGPGGKASTGYSDRALQGTRAGQESTPQASVLDYPHHYAAGRI